MCTGPNVSACAICPPSQMSDTRAAAWQWMHMLPLTLWSSPPAKVIRQHGALPGSSCRCCPYWRVQRFFLLPHCASLCWWWCWSPECWAVTLSETLTYYVCFSLLPFLSCFTQILFCFHYFGILFTQHRFFFDVECVFVSMCNATPMKTFNTITVMEINLTTEVTLIEIRNPPMCTNKQTGGRGHREKAILEISSLMFFSQKLFIVATCLMNLYQDLHSTRVLINPHSII